MKKPAHRLVLYYNIIMPVSYSVIYDLEQDAFNWFTAVNQFNQENKPHLKKDRCIANEIKNISFDKAKKILIPYLKTRKNLNIDLLDFNNILQEQLDKHFNNAVVKLEEVTKHPLAIENCVKNRHLEAIKGSQLCNITMPKTDLLFFITTFPAMTIYYNEGIIFCYAKIDDCLWGMPLDGILHELMHLQTDFYYRQNPNSPVSELSDDEYFILKESLTVLLDESWKPIITLPDCSYPEYGKIRRKLQMHYQQYKNFEKLMEYGVKLIKSSALHKS